MAQINLPCMNAFSIEKDKMKSFSAFFDGILLRKHRSRLTSLLLAVADHQTDYDNH